MTDRERPPIVPALRAATVLLLRDDPFEVLMVRRRSASFFSSALVFPGGMVDPEDAGEAWLGHVAGAAGLSVEQRALRVAACRETYEEASVLLGVGNVAVAAGVPFIDIVAKHGAKLPLDAMTRFGHWITPIRAKKRFDTHFYLCAAPEGAEPRCDGDETVELEWVAPRDALRRSEEGETTLLFPTLMNLKRLAESGDASSALAAARMREIVTVMPTVEKRPAGLVVCIPEEAGYGITEFAAPEVAGKPAD